MLITTLAMAALVVVAGALLHRRDPGAVRPAVRRALADADRVGLRLPFALLFASFTAALVPAAASSSPGASALSAPDDPPSAAGRRVAPPAASLSSPCDAAAPGAAGRRGLRYRL